MGATLDDLGMTFDFRGAVEMAYNAGRGKGLIDNVQEITAIWQHGLEVPLRVSYDEMRAQAYLAQLAHEIERAPPMPRCVSMASRWLLSAQ